MRITLGELRFRIQRSLLEGKVRVTPERKEFKSWAGMPGHFIRFTNKTSLPASLPRTRSPTFEVDGLWAYPADPDVIRHCLMQKAEFSDETDQVQLLRAKDPSRLLRPDSDAYKRTDLRADLDRLHAQGYDVDAVLQQSNSTWRRKDPLDSFAAGISPSVALKVMISALVNGQQEAAAAWAGLYDGIDDRAGWLITPDGDYEQQQAIFFRLDAVELVKSIKNPCKYVERLS